MSPPMQSAPLVWPPSLPNLAHSTVDLRLRSPQRLWSDSQCWDSETHGHWVMRDLGFDPGVELDPLTNAAGTLVGELRARA